MPVLKNFLLCTDVWSLVSYTRNHFVNSDVNYSYIFSFLYADSDVNYNCILVSKDVLQLSGKEVELSCERNINRVTRKNYLYSWELNWYIKLPYKNRWRLTAGSYHARTRS